MSKWKQIKNTERIKKIFELKIKILRLTREFFWQFNFLEVETPIAVKYPGQEPYLDPVAVVFNNPSGLSEKFFLRTSPEFALKKILAAGYEKIFELGKCFRNFEEWGGNHNIEFTMLEFYRAPGGQFEIMNDIEFLFKFVGEKLGIKKFDNCQIDCDWERITMKELWQKELNINLDENLDLVSLSKTAESLGFKIQKEDVYEDVFYKIFLNKIETKLGKEKPVFVIDYPAQMCSLSKKCIQDNRYAERFELYIDGLEIANGFGELTDGEKQQELLEIDKRKRKELGKEIWEVDVDFIEALKSLDSLPSVAKDGAAGVALGFDRMVKLFAEANNLNEVIFGSVADQVENN